MPAAAESSRLADTIRRALLVALGASVVAAAARPHLDLPGTEIPQTAQTLAVLVIGGLYGRGLGATALSAYLLAGAIGLPVFADGAAGLDVLLGPTGGFVLAFVPAAALAGWAARAAARRRPVRRALLVLVLALLAAHALILLCGALRLALLVGPAAAWRTGVAPFLLGALLKSVAAAIVVACAGRFSGLGACRAT